MDQTRLDARASFILDANPADLLTQADREYLSLVARVMGATLATVVVMLAAGHANQPSRSESRGQMVLPVQAPARTHHAAAASPIVGSAAIDARGIPELTHPIPYAYVHIDAR